MSHVTHQNCSAFIRNVPEPCVVPLPWVRTPATNKYLGAKIERFLLELVIIYIPRLRINFIWETLKEYGSSRDFLPTWSVITMTQVPSRRRIQSHNPIIGEQEPSVNRKICRGTRIRLNIYTPFLRIKIKSSQSTLATEQFNVINMLIARIKSCPRHSLGVLVRQMATQSFHNSFTHKILRSYQLNSSKLSMPLLLHNFMNLWIRNLKRLVPPRRHRFPPPLDARLNDTAFRNVCREKRRPVSPPLQAHRVPQNAKFLVFPLIHPILNPNLLILLIKQLKRNRG
ncbi:hypothetical protein TorRG33x02_003860 [Trema orientale]|uniref:Uncharacterized protein n=1 Tax=Trema orientale TaxID=63057 RepID=A0A2P5G226_TREOI|nr:hypothetical protein TorRG33x02_003860 [Trema orientale]